MSDLLCPLLRRRHATWTAMRRLSPLVSLLFSLASSTLRTTATSTAKGRFFSMAPHAQYPINGGGNDTPAAHPYSLLKNALTLGYEIPSPAKSPKDFTSVSNRAGQYHPLPGTYTARDLVKLSAPLLLSVLARLDKSPSPPSPESHISETLIQGLSSCLSTSTRESTLPISPTSSSDSSRKEILQQATLISKTLISYLRQALSEGSPSPPSDWLVSSRCENHLWTHATAALLLGPRSHGDLMELYNEWLHRMILLRDALIPFENFEEVPLVIRSGTRGLRAAERARKGFLLEALSSKVSHKTIVDLAKAFTAPGLPEGGYGFQYAGGIVLPGFLAGSSGRRYLLRWYPAKIEEGERKEEVLFEYEYESYREGKRELPSGEEFCRAAAGSLAAEVDGVGIAKARIAARAGSAPDRVRLAMELEFGEGDSKCVSVDVGQIARGWRFAYDLPRAEGGAEKKSAAADSWASASSQWKGSVFVRDVAKTLAQPGLLVGSTSGQIQVFPAANEVLRLALLGKLYPENVILYKQGGVLAGLEQAGKGFGSRLLVV